ncbi:ferrous iron transport protein A [Rhodovulum sp. BSW8]|uniref:Ferrous iron transport protein A n=1 Tax=Rhodovulum visakhapatnamense TaxID=364297 RepID=A0A4R8G9I6_9RHOB|nr:MULTISPECIES: ferrous iron transport protein A [Rhodovulum]OLS43337.1 ferrous iron transport protein A [Rhodovulum sulfidophilum]MBL3569510.1 ferrous iron transport protein A [Rhodovulum visakhapatnamense]MBL3577661.1 ferrous iron transport protein A [Rhodovulum visakhapatnamense]RBO52289.1 ferrous iron transport protein A [Rhodovulum sp. BSW8]TDX33384.1 ferrous iron transport protein A [Rhodovulum visakhapatnamense]
MENTLPKMGTTVRVKSFARGDRAGRERLLTMGLTPGTELTVTRVAPMGDPIEIRVRGFALSLRKDEFALLTLEAVD